MKITEKEIKEAREILQKYKDGKASLEKRIVDEEKFWKLQHWDVLRNNDGKSMPVSAWMFNSIANKHADAMDAYPEVKCLPREKSDEEAAEIMTSIIPVTLERNNFEEIYSKNWWYKLKHGCSAYGVFWDNGMEKGLGDVCIKKLDLLNIFWEPGITELDRSRNLFTVELIPTDELNARYKKMDFKGGEDSMLKKYLYDDNVDTADKTLVVDWYYKKINKDGKTVLHYCKFAEDKVLYASENDEAYKDRGWYDDGEYPIVFDVLYPEEGTPAGFGIISITKDPQLYIDKLDNAIMDYAMAAAHPRFFAKRSSGINPADFLDTSKAIVEVEGDLDDKKVKQITLNPLNSYIMNFRGAKIDEMKETSSNRDFSNGSTMGGVTSGAAIATLQEAGNKTSRDMISASYRAYTKIAERIIERMRQFYTEERVFRITSGSGIEYISFNNSQIAPQKTGDIAGMELFREPVFDVSVRAQKRSPYSTLSSNETAINLYKMGFFAPERASQSLAALKLMDFEGKRDVEEYLQNIIQEVAS